MNAKTAKKLRKLSRLSSSGLLHESYFIKEHPSNPSKPDVKTAEIRVSPMTLKGKYKALKKSLRRT